MKELIELAKEKGFYSNCFTYGKITNNILKHLDTIQYLWLCELKKWLMDEHKIYVSSQVNDVRDNSRDFEVSYIHSGCFLTVLPSLFDSDTEALTEGLKKALTLI